MNRRDTIVGLLALGVAIRPLTAFGQQKPQKIYRIGFLSAAFAASPALAVRIDSFRAGLRELGYLEGRNITIETRWAEGKAERLPELAAELVRMNVDVIVTQGTPAAIAAKKATATIPVVMGPVVDPVGTGLVASLARPGGNVTGMTYFLAELCQKRLELLKEISQRLKRVAVLMNPDNAGMPLVLKALEPPAKSLNLELQPYWAHQPDELDSAFAAMVAKRVDAVVIVEDPWLTGNIRHAVELANRNRILSISSDDIAEAGGLMAYGMNFPNAFRYLAVFVDKIFKGARPADLPVERPTRFEMIVNLRTAKLVGVTIPQSILVRADRVIE